MKEIEVRKNVDDIGSVLHIEVLVSLSPKAAEVRLASLVDVPGSSAAAMACESLEAIVVGARREVVHGEV